jgi:hypothetical protein
MDGGPTLIHLHPIQLLHCGKVGARKDREDDKEPSVPRSDEPKTVNQERRIKARESKNSKKKKIVGRGGKNTPDKDNLPNPDPATTADYDKGYKQFEKGSQMNSMNFQRKVAITGPRTS